MNSNFTITATVESVLTELEIQRKKIAASNIQGWGALILGIASLAIAVSLGQLTIGIIIGLAGIIPGGIILYRISDDIAAYKSRFKQEVVGAALSHIDQSLTIEPNKGIFEFGV